MGEHTAMKPPRTVSICGRKFRVVTTKAIPGNAGMFDLLANTIHLAPNARRYWPEILTHEIIEAILTDRGHRFLRFAERDGNNGIRFVLDHDDFDNVCKDITAALKGVRL